MKVVLKLTIDFESWFEPDREPKTKEEWGEFFYENYLAIEGSVIGYPNGDFQDQAAIDGIEFECLEIIKDS